MMLLMYRHGVRVAEPVYLRWEMCDLKTALFHVQRVKNGIPSGIPSCPPNAFRISGTIDR
jgi:type 1 fimbriae regulatory protein FimB/type 1 fimbriae regulatory protein FimE